MRLGMLGQNHGGPGMPVSTPQPPSWALGAPQASRDSGRYWQRVSLVSQQGCSGLERWELSRKPAGRGTA